MSVIVVGSEKNFAALRPRLFSGSVSTKAAGEVSAAIQEANPHADLKALTPGTVLTVPDDLRRVSVAGELSLDVDTTARAAGVVEAGAATLGRIAEVAREGAAGDAALRRSLARSLAGKQIGAAAGQDKAVAASLEAARKALGEADAASKTRADALAQAQARWNEELNALQALLPTR
jgi:hypothetical protein